MKTEKEIQKEIELSYERQLLLRAEDYEDRIRETMKRDTLKWVLE